MSNDKFVVKRVSSASDESEYVIVSLRMRLSMRQKFDVLAKQSGHSRNELMCSALSFALNNLEFLSENGEAATLPEK